MARDLTDFGVRLHLKGTAGTYVDVKGATKNGGVLTASYTALPDAQAIFQMGATQRAALAVAITLAGATSITVKLETKRRDENNPSLFDFAFVQTVQQKNGDVLSEHTFTADGTYWLQTESQGPSGDAKISAKAAGTIAAGTLVVVGVNAW